MSDDKDIDDVNNLERYTTPLPLRREQLNNDFSTPVQCMPQEGLYAQAKASGRLLRRAALRRTRGLYFTEGEILAARRKQPKCKPINVKRMRDDDDHLSSNKFARLVAR